MPSVNANQIEQALKQVAAPWQVLDNPISNLSDVDRRFRLGYTPGGTEPSLLERERLAAANKPSAGKATAAPPQQDWRNVGGKDYVTPIKDQKNCGSCVAFGTIAAVESLVRIIRHNPSLQISLSEAHLFYCYGEQQHGRSCASGWFIGQALDSLKTGVVDTPCFPYTPGDQPCKLCADWQRRLTRITAWKELGDIGAMKNWIASTGPLITAFTVYEDFFYYGGGVYRHVSGKEVGGHCVCVVGYNDHDSAWICKNSWGSWGEGGFFRIRYGEVGIDAMMWAVEGTL